MLVRRMVPERGVQAGPVIEALDVVEDGEPRLRASPEAVVIQPFGFEGVEEALDDGVVEAIAGSAHAANHPVAIEHVLVVGARVLSAAVGVMQETGGRTPAVDRLLQRLDRQRLLGSRGRRPAYDPTREEIEDDREKEPAFAGADLRDV